MASKPSSILPLELILLLAHPRLATYHKSILTIGASKVVVGKYAGEDMALDSFIEADTQGRDTSGQRSEEIKVIR